MAYSPASTAYHGQALHRIWVKNGDLVLVYTNPEPSVSDPASVIGTTIATYHVLDEGSMGAQLVHSRERTYTISDRIANDSELARH